MKGSWTGGARTRSESSWTAAGADGQIFAAAKGAVACLLLDDTLRHPGRLRRGHVGAELSVKALGDDVQIGRGAARLRGAGRPGTNLAGRVGPPREGRPDPAGWRPASPLWSASRAGAAQRLISTAASGFE
jgi:hypothetical protein